MKVSSWVWLPTSFDSRRATFLKIMISGMACPFFENDAAEKTRWLSTFPKESACPSNVFNTSQWNLVDAAMKLQRIYIEHKSWRTSQHTCAVQYSR